MSDMEYHTGRAEEIQFPGELAHEQKIAHLKALGHEFEYEEEDDVYSDTIVKFEDGRFFEIDNRELDGTECVAKKKEDGSFSYNLAFYNGGGSLTEVLEEAIIEAEENNSTKE